MEPEAKQRKCPICARPMVPLNILWLSEQWECGSCKVWIPETSFQNATPAELREEAARCIGAGIVR